MKSRSKREPRVTELGGNRTSAPGFPREPSPCRCLAIVLSSIGYTYSTAGTAEIFTELPACHGSRHGGWIHENPHLRRSSREETGHGTGVATLTHAFPIPPSSATSWIFVSYDLARK
jgi:hypothetical protein